MQACGGGGEGCVNILGHIVYNNILGNVNIQYTEQDFRTVCIRQDIYNGVICNFLCIMFSYINMFCVYDTYLSDIAPSTIYVSLYANVREFNK